MKLISDFKRSLQTQKNSANPIVARGVQSIYSTYKLLKVCKTFFTNDNYRYITLVKLLKPQKLHQTTTLTKMNRYPKIFAACASYFGERKDLKILSFGCSTGEEVVSLRQYFPSALITGAEINPRALAACRARAVDDRIEFIRSDRETIKQHAPFDAIFCMAVLQRTPHKIIDLGITDLKRIYPFEKFERQISELDSCLKKDGLLVIHHTQYMFGETSIAAGYEPLGGAGEQQETDDNPKFDRNSLRVENPLGRGSIFIKKRV